QRHAPMVWGVCRRILANYHDAQDAFQATFLVLVRKAASIASRKLLANWLYGVAHQTALKARATAAKRKVRERQVTEMPEPAVSEQDLWPDLQPLLDAELSRLPDKYRAPLVLCDLEGKTRKEAARQLGWPEGTVAGRLARARVMLARRLTRHGLTVSGGALAMMLSPQAASAGVPAPVMAATIKATNLLAAGQAIAPGVISTKVAALTEGVLQTMSLTKLKTTALVLVVVGILGSGVGLLAHQALTNKIEITQTAKEKNKTAAAQDKGGKEFNRPQLSGKVVRVDKDNKALTLEILSKPEGIRKVVIKITDKTQLVFSHVGPKEAKLTEGYTAQLWLEKDSKDVATRVQLSGRRNVLGSVLNEKITQPQLALPVVAVTADGKGITLENRKGETGVKFVIRFTEKTRILFANVARDGARPKVGYWGRVWLEDNSRDTA